MARTTVDAFLGGRLQIEQPVSGYRAGIDPVFLAAAVPAVPGQSVLELGCGAGVGLLCLGARVPRLRLTGVELQPEYAELARANSQRNGQGIDIHQGDVARLPAQLLQQRFDHVMLNPPWFLQQAATPARDKGRATAMSEDTPLTLWIDAASRRLLPRGRISLIHRAERLPDILGALQPRLGSIEVLPLAPREGRAAHLVLVRARKEGRAAFCLHAAVVLHEGQTHEADRESYSPAIRDVLRSGAAFPYPELKR